MSTTRCQQPASKTARVMAQTCRAGAVFLDKDGTLVDDVPFNVDPALIRLSRGAVQGLQRLRDLGFRLFVVSNQSGVALGRFPEESLRGVEHRLRQLCEAGDVPIAGFYWCPHHPEGVNGRYRVACDCRKPAPGMLLRAAREHGVELAESWLIGDILHDVEAGRRAGCRTILLDNGNETEWVLTPDRRPHYLAEDLEHAARIIAECEGECEETVR